ncbi:hypothetical protein [Glutamicibacter sp. PS]|uniref:hypothetical protein n=1 Tax=Glutamicibacter sp. PS TaxID=3075634 RepID=UPI0028419634|nr:hypothetical protein [Glutamicibacter sp. PS]MDR4532309.1 hypothetical protein [Glutamicibacter sp. PS]
MPAPNTRAKGGTLGGLWRAGVAALVGAVFGTLAHASLTYLGDIPLPWGLALAWALLGVLVYWATVASGKLWAGALSLLLCYVLVGAISFLGNDQLILSIGYLQYLPAPTVVSLLWMYGMIIPAVIGLLRALKVLRLQRAG